MRQWMVNPRIMCTKHLLGEHSEHHMFMGSIKKKIKMDGYLKNNLLEPLMLKIRHDFLAVEMRARGYKHKSDIEDITYKDLEYLGSHEKINHKIDIASSYDELLRRCKDCRNRYREVYYKDYEEVVNATKVIQDASQAKLRRLCELAFNLDVGEINSVVISNGLVSLGTIERKFFMDVNKLTDLLRCLKIEVKKKLKKVVIT